jgi:hypothetical protein
VSAEDYEWDLSYEYTDDWTWEALGFTLYFARTVTERERKELERLVQAWYEVGVFGGFGVVEGGKGVMHYLGSIEFKDDGNKPRVEWWADMGSAPMFALASLMLCLQNWSQEAEVSLKKLVFGYHDGFTAGP